MRSLSWIVAALLIAAPTAAAAKGPRGAATTEVSANERRATTLRMLDATGSLPSAKLVLDQLLGTFRQTMPQVPGEFWDRVAQRITVEDMIGELAAVYERHFSHDEILALLGFYESELGRKLATAQPKLTEEGMAVGQAWGERVAAQVMADLTAEGLIAQ